MDQNPIQRLSWRVIELPGVTGLSLPFLRKAQYAGRLKTRKIGRAVIVLDEDLKQFLNGNKETQEVEKAKRPAS